METHDEFHPGEKNKTVLRLGLVRVLISTGASFSPQAPPAAESRQKASAGGVASPALDSAANTNSPTVEELRRALNEFSEATRRDLYQPVEPSLGTAENEPTTEAAQQVTELPDSYSGPAVASAGEPRISLLESNTKQLRLVPCQDLILG